MRRLRDALRDAATDSSQACALRSALVIAPHPDDETLGCGAAIARKTDAGRPVHVVVCTDGSASHRSKMIPPKDLAQIREVEAGEAVKVLGVPRENLAFLRFEDGHLQHRREALLHELADVITASQPDEILAPCGIDRHPDHRAIASVMDELVQRKIVNCPVLDYPVWFWTARAWGGGGAGFSALSAILRPNRVAQHLNPSAVSTEGYLERKRRAIACHKSQVTNLTGEPGWGVLEPAFLDHFLQPYELYFGTRRPAVRAAG